MTKEQQVLDNWLKESDQNRNQLSHMEQVWEAAGNLSVKMDLNTDLAWENIAQKTQSRTSRLAYFMTPTSMKIAASILLFFTIGGLFFLLTPESEIVHQTAGEERMKVMLPDSSLVWLNQSSTLAYSENFITDRTISLNGEAYFEVTHNAQSPFTVHTSSISTTVLGTSFTVNDYEENFQSEVVVATGRVKVSASSRTSGEVFLEPGTRAIYQRSSNELVKSNDPDLNYLAWKDRKLRFDNTTLTEIELVLEKYFDIEIVMDKDQLGSCQFTGSFKDPTIEEVLQVISVALDVDHSKQKGVYQFTGDGCKVIDR